MSPSNRIFDRYSDKSVLAYIDLMREAPQRQAAFRKLFINDPAFASAYTGFLSNGDGFCRHLLLELGYKVEIAKGRHPRAQVMLDIGLCGLRGTDFQDIYACMCDKNMAHMLLMLRAIKTDVVNDDYIAAFFQTLTKHPENNLRPDFYAIKACLDEDKRRKQMKERPAFDNGWSLTILTYN